MSDTTPTSPDDLDPARADDASDIEVAGTTSGDPVAGARMTEAEHETAVEPDDDAQEVDGPTQKHA